MTKGDIERYRVEAAIAAMQGMLGNSHYTDGGATSGDIARWSAQQADALMAELGLGGE